MANSEIKVGLKFSADVSRAKQDIKSLESAMSDLMTSIAKTDSMDSLTDGLGEARESAQKLQAALQQSVNIKTGQFDLSKFSKTLKDYGTNLKEVSANLQKLGPEGEVAFNSLTSSIVSAEIPAKRVNKTFAEFTKQLKNVARYQISTKIYNELVGSLEQAWIYAKNLNKSLNDIRIVTGYNVDDMAQFAEKANAAARALSSTTNEYAKASLIYFQQGLSDAEVEQRTATTIKLANVTGQSAQEVSEYMTAVWNNFDDGTKSLEYYADAITKLGAATASSSEEIATGLQKFSAVAQSVGLSYEYATSMLATVTSQTRESAETVGTSFKTILARLESLSLGETLDDETTITKYSQALAKVGVSIKDQTGALKDMDTIIQEIGETWKTISVDQRIALAQTVAGMRQYNNFIALMDNYDTFQMNVQLATDSEGSLQEQADIYAESWEAATKRVQAAAEELYDKLINDEFFIDLLNIIEKLINGFSNLVDTMGGVPGLLTTIGFVLTKVYHKQISAGIADLSESFSNNRKNIIKLKEDAVKTFKDLSAYRESTQFESDAEAKAFENKIDLQLAIAENEDKLNSSQRLRLQLIQQEQEALRLKSVELAKQAAQAETDYFTRKKRIKEEAEARHKASLEQLINAKGNQTQLQGSIQEYGNIARQYSTGEIDEQAFFSEINKLSQKVQDSFDISVDEGAGAFVDKLKEIKSIIIDTLKSTDEGVTERFKQSVSEEFSEQQLSDDILYNRARQFAKESDMEYGDSVQVIKQLGQSQEIVYDKEKTYRESGIVEAGQRNLDIVEAYKNSVGPELEQAAEDEAAKVRDSFMSSDKNIDEAFGELRTNIDAYSEKFGQSEPEIAAALEEFYQAIKKKKEELETTDVRNFSIVQSVKSDNVDRQITEAAGLDLNQEIEGWKNESERSRRKEKGGRTGYFARKTRSTLIKKEIAAQGVPELSFSDRKSRRMNKRKKAEQALGNDVENKAQLDAVDAMIEATEEQIKVQEHAQKITQDGIKVTEEQVNSLKEGILKASEGLMGLASAVNMITGLVDTLRDPTKDSGEKVIATVQTLLTMLPILIATFGTLIKVKGKDLNTTIAQTAAQALQNVKIGFAIAMNKLFKKSIDETTKAKLAENAAWLANPAVWIIAAIVAALALVTAGVITLTKKLSASAKAAKELEEARDIAKSFEEELAKVTAEAQELKESFDKYDTIRDKLDSCVYGTKEWNEALSENNAQVLELLDKYPELTSMVKNGESAIQKNASGALTVTDWAMEDLESQAGSRVQHATVANIVAKQNIREKEIELQKANMVGDILPGVVGKPVEELAKNLDKIIDLSGDELEAELKKIDGVNAAAALSWKESIEKFQKSGSEDIDKLKEALNANTLATQAESEVIKQTLLANNEIIQDSEYSNQIKASTSDFDKFLEREKKRLENEGWGTKDINKSETEKDEDAQEVWKEFLAAQGLDTKDYELTGVTGIDENRAFTYRTFNEETGKYEEDFFTLEEMRLKMATANAEKAMTNEAEKIAKEYAEMEKDQIAVLTAARSGDTSYMSYEDLQKYYRTDEEGRQFINSDAVVDAFQGKVTSLEEVKKIQEALTKGQIAFSQVQNAFGASTHMSFSELSEEAQKNLSIGAINSLNQSLSDLSMIGGTDMAANFMKQVDVIMQQYPDKVEEISALVGNIDWSQGGAEALAGFTGDLKEIGVAVDATTDGWAAMAEEVNGIKKSIEAFDFNEVRKELATVQKLTNSIKLSDVISDQEFETLRKYSSEVDKLFIKTADGYQFIGKDATQLGKITTDTIKQQIRDQMKLLDLAEKGAKTNRLNQEKSNNDFEDMIAVAGMKLDENGNLAELENDTYAVFREAYGIDADKLAEMGRLGLEAQKKLEEENLSEADRLLYEDQLKKSQLAADDMYAKAQDMSGRDYSAERQANADVYASTYESVMDLEAAAAEFKGNSFFEKAYEKQLEYLQNVQEEYKKQIDYYADEERALKRIGKELDRLAKRKEGAYGQKYLEVLDKENLELEKSIAWNEKLRQMAGKDQASSLYDLNDYIQELESDKGELIGDIFNTETNELLVGIEDIELLKSQLNSTERAKIDELFGRYLESEERIESYTQAIEDDTAALKSNTLERISYAKTFNDSIRDMELDVITFQMEALANSEFSAAESMGLLTLKTKLYAESARDALKTGIKDIIEQFNNEEGLEKEDGESDFDYIQRLATEVPAAKDAVIGLSSTYLSELQQIRDVDKELADSVVTYFEELGEHYDKHAEKLERLTTMANYYRDIVDLVGKDNFEGSDEALLQLNKFNQLQANRQLEISMAKSTDYADQLEQARNYLSNALEKGDVGNAEYWKEKVEEIEAMAADAQEEVMESWQNALQTAADVFADETARILENFEESMTGTFGSFERMSEVFSQQSQLSSQYLADYKKVYELSKLTRNIEKTMNDSDSLAAKQEMRELQEEITSLQQSGTEMSQYDLEYLQKKYDLRVAEIALEEAQNAKSQVKLQKMADGSWGYVYTQNADAVQNAQQNYEDKLYALQELSSNYLDQTSEQIISTQSEFKQAIDEIMNSGLTEEEKKKQIEETVQFYQERLQFLTSEYDQIISNNQGFANMAQSFSDTLLGSMYPNEEFDSAESIFDMFNANVGNWEEGTGVLGELKASLTEFENSTTEIFRRAGYNSMEEFIAGLAAGVNSMDAEGESILKEMEENAPSNQALRNFLMGTSQMRKDLVKEYDAIIKNYGEFLSGMSGTKINTDGTIKLGSFVFSKPDPSSYDTGGYTGSWGSSGKLAVLHEKELVLNKQDTENLLHTMEIMDRLIKTIDLNAAAAAYSSRLANFSIGENKETLQQEVTIHAEFPNATNHSEIEQALESLVNRASQYAHRTR